MEECPYCKKEIKDGSIQCEHCKGDIFVREDNNKRLERYREREVRWADKAIEQLGFLNNLLLTLGIAFVTLLYGKDSFWIYKCSVCFMSLSIMAGVFCLVNRLRDFRITRYINTTRRRVYENNGQLLDRESPLGYKWKEVFGVFQYLTYDLITTNEAKENNYREKFTRLRRIAHQLGDNTWILLYTQLSLFLSGVLLFLLVVIFSKPKTSGMLLLSF